jgi:hypothetical protein
MVFVALVGCGAPALASKQIASHCGSQGCIEFYSDGHRYYVYYLGLDGARILSAELPAPKSERTLERHEMRLVDVEQIQYLGHADDVITSKSNKCGADGWGWYMGDLTFDFVQNWPGTSTLQFHQWGIYQGQGRQTINSQSYNFDGTPLGPVNTQPNQPAAEKDGTPGECREEQKEN